MLLQPEFTEIGLTLVSLGLLFIYHLQLYRQVRDNPLSTAIGLTNHARRVWVQSIVDKKRDILAVQTFRNWVMASTFLASTAILISLGLVASTFRTEITSSATHALNVFGHPSETLWIIKLFVLSALFFYAFFNFTLSMRYYNHASLLINVSPDLEPSSSVESVASILNHGALHYTLGMRGFYLAIPLGLCFSVLSGCLGGRFWWCLSFTGWTGRSDPAATRNNSAASEDFPHHTFRISSLRIRKNARPCVG